MYNVYVFKCQLMSLTLSSYESFLSSNSSLYIQICSPNLFPNISTSSNSLHYISQLYIFLHFLSDILTSLYFLKIIFPFLFLFFFNFNLFHNNKYHFFPNIYISFKNYIFSLRCLPISPFLS